MKKELLRLTVLASLAFTGQTLAQTPATATWTLSADRSASISATDANAITATDQAFGTGITGVTYGNTYDVDNPNGGNTGWQKISDKSAESSYGTAVNANFYTEYKVTAAPGKYLQVNSVKVSIVGTGGSTNRLAAVYSLDGFAHSSPLANPTATYKTEGVPPVSSSYAATEADPVSLINVGNTSTADLDGREVLTFSNLQINVNSGQTFSVRFYYWQTGTGNRFVASKNVTISGKTAASPIPLPLDFLSFNASLMEGLTKRVKLNWSTTNEIRTKKFVIEKNTGEGFEDIGEVNSNNTEGLNHYSFTDINPFNGTAYYRLQQIDQDGIYKYSSIISLENKINKVLSVYPIPVIDKINISHVKAAKKASISIFDANSRRISSVSVAEGSTLSTIDASSFQKGTFLLVFYNGGQKSVVKILK